MPRKKAAAQYDAHKTRSAKRQAGISAAGREIGELPPVANPARKARALRDLRFFLETYFPHSFSLNFSPDHLTAIAALEQATIHGGLFALAMPRGSGKTTLSEGAALWALLGGHRRFVMLIGADEDAGIEQLESIKTELSTNELLLEDFPEVCYPIHALEGIHQRAGGQRYRGRPTASKWTAKQLVLPTVAGSQASGATLRVRGITGRIRGAKRKTDTGESIRPDLVLLDDPQDDDSARSPRQVAKREGIVSGAVLGLAGPGQKISAVCACTVICPDDLADRLLDRDKHPEWQGLRTKLCYSLPDNEKLWNEYADIRRRGLNEGDRGQAATEFYRKHQAAMDAGCRPAWPERFNSDELSAVQYCMNLKIDNPLSFAAEYQNEPVAPQGTAGGLKREQVLARIGGPRRGTCPGGAEHVVAKIDVHDDVLYYVVCALRLDFSGAVIDYGTLPDQGLSYFAHTDAKKTLGQAAPAEAKGKQAAIYWGLVHLGDRLFRTKYGREDGLEMRLSYLTIDAGYLPRIVDRAARELWARYPGAVFPERGHGVGAKDRPLAEWRHKPSDRRGNYWGLFKRDAYRCRVVDVDVNFWKSRLRDAMLAQPEEPGGLVLFGRDAVAHRMIADHFAAEYPVETEGRGRRVEEWALRPGRDNHYLDCAVGCLAGGSFLGCRLPGAADLPAQPARKRVKLSEVQRQKRGE